VWQNSWGLTTRTIGVCVMVHGDDKGLVLPPRVAPLQVVIVAVYSAAKDGEEAKAAILAACEAAAEALNAAGIRARHDDRDNYSPGWKYSHWEQKGVPLRLECGPRDLAAGAFTGVRRCDGARVEGGLPIGAAALPPAVAAALRAIQGDMLAAARRTRDERLSVVTQWKDFVPALDRGHMVLAPWCELVEAEEWVKEQTGPKAKAAAAAAAAEAAAGGGGGAAAAAAETAEEVEASKSLTGAAKTLCIPLVQPPMPEGTLCFTGNGKPAVSWALWGRSY